MMARVRKDGQLISCIEEHDALLLDEINTRVGPNDELIVVGDFAWDKPGKYRAQIKCKTVRLVKGNHDKMQASLNVFGQMPDTLNTRVYNQSGNDHMKIFVSHYPHAFWDGSHRGWGHLYGHCHGQREEYLDALEPQRKAMDIGVDNVYRLFGHYGPLCETEVYDYLGRRSGHDDVRFYEDYQRGLYAERNVR